MCNNVVFTLILSIGLNRSVYIHHMMSFIRKIKKGDKIYAVVFDGIITQRLLDIAHNKNVKEIVGIKLGNVGKMPKSVKVLTKSDFS